MMRMHIIDVTVMVNMMFTFTEDENNDVYNYGDEKVMFIYMGDDKGDVLKIMVTIDWCLFKLWWRIWWGIFIFGDENGDV